SLRFLSSRRAALRHLPSFPTRRSSDLQRISRLRLASRHIATPYRRPPDDRSQLALPRRRPALVCYRERKRSPDQTGRFPPTTDRSEEHTSELQSRENLVCRLLLEKKNR